MYSTEGSTIIEPSSCPNSLISHSSKDTISSLKKKVMTIWTDLQRQIPKADGEARKKRLKFDIPPFSRVHSLKRLAPPQIVMPHSKVPRYYTGVDRERVPLNGSPVLGLRTREEVQHGHKPVNQEEPYIMRLRAAALKRETYDSPSNVAARTRTGEEPGCNKLVITRKIMKLAILVCLPRTTKKDSTRPSQKRWIYCARIVTRRYSGQSELSWVANTDETNKPATIDGRLESVHR
ncbi:hypothetical protein EDD18DRAFT_1420240 [Armillaria luteobubalina]|uniref:Uncharacterized protein n=1 Tax=Armillaria luteobubalina TaxID=153913 RepID=A0AA39PQ43_9AGAR|nr:hypothetical protein EDD18DRAFT_1420240 [Armillaria luteobubalina]